MQSLHVDRVVSWHLHGLKLGSFKRRVLRLTLELLRLKNLGGLRSHELLWHLLVRAIANALMDSSVSSSPFRVS